MNIEQLFPDQNRHVRFLLGLYITRKRKEQDLSVPAIAARLGITAPIYKRIESGRMKLNDSLFEKMRLLLSLEQEDLIEINRIAAIRYINDLSKILTFNYPA